MTGPSDALTPVQEATLAHLRRADPVVFDTGFVTTVREEMRAALDGFAERLGPGEEIFVSKHRIATVLDCEEFHVLPDDFSWSPASARGQVAHRAIQLRVWWKGETDPIDLVDEAMARLADEERGIGPWIAGLGPADVADLRGLAVEHVTKFVESFPPLDKRAHPVTESAVRWPNDGPILLQAKVDLMLGRPEGAESRKLIVDLKTGRPNARHRQDLGFYALVETLARGVPPRKVATFYLDAAHAEVDDVSERLLRTAMRRTLDAIHAMVELQSEGRSPVRRPGVTCRWCPLNDTCPDGRGFLAARTGDL